MAETLRTVRFLIFGVVMVLPSTPALAQDKLLMVLRTKSGISQQEVTELVEDTLSKVGSPGKPNIVQLTAMEFNAFERVTNPGASPVQLPNSVSGKVELRQLPESEPLWQFRLLEKQPRLVQSIEVTYKDGTTQPFPVGKAGSALRGVVPGTYQLTLPASKSPDRYTLTAQNSETSEIVSIAGEFPKGNNFYLIRLDNFPAEKQRAFQSTITDKQQVVNALESFDIKNGVTLAVGELEPDDPQSPDELMLKGNRIVVQFAPLPKNRPAARVWIYFPLNSDQVEQEEAKLRGLSARQLSATIRSAGAISAQNDVAVTADQGAKWFEVPPAPSGQIGFRRDLPLVRTVDDVTSEEYLELLQKYPTGHYLVVYEFDDGQTPPGAQKYRSVTGQPDAQFVNRSIYRNWSQALKNFADSKKLRK